MYENLQICINKAAQIPHQTTKLTNTPTTPSLYHIAPFIRDFVNHPSPHFRNNMFRVNFVIPVDACGKRVLFRDIDDHPGPGNNDTEKQIMKSCHSIMDYPVHTNIPIVVDIAGYTRKEVDVCIPWVKVLLLFMYNESQQFCRKGMRIILLLTPFKRRRDQGYVNGGLTTGCQGNQGEILVYREEEWFKVLIHELFHRVGLEWSHTITDPNDKSFESYVEYWASRMIVMMRLKEEEYEEGWKDEKKNTSEKCVIIRRTKMDKEAAISEYYERKGRMMGMKILSKEEEEKADREIEDLRMTKGDMTFRPLPTTTTKNKTRKRI